MGADLPPAAPASPEVGGVAPHFSARLGAWVKPLRTAERTKQGFVRRPGNVTLSERGKVWLAIILYCAACWAGLAWIWHDFFVGGGLG
jgi:hypothetical protein